MALRLVHLKMLLRTCLGPTKRNVARLLKEKMFKAKKANHLHIIPCRTFFPFKQQFHFSKNSKECTCQTIFNFHRPHSLCCMAILNMRENDELEDLPEKIKSENKKKVTSFMVAK